MSGDPSPVRGQARSHPLQGEQAYQASTGDIWDRGKLGVSTISL